ncbi:gliding motility-associated C-terminal domain-containing protein [Bacteroidota bacterium]
MRIIILNIVLFISFCNILSQYIQNSSFEGETGAIVPDGWFVCENISSPDVHGPNGLSGFSGSLITQSPVDGNTYLVLKARGPYYINDGGETPPISREHIGTKLLIELEKDLCYEFSVFLCWDEEVFMNSEIDQNTTYPVKFNLWGGIDSCSRYELLIESALISNTEWQEYTFRFIPDANYTHILIESQWDDPLDPYNGVILLDNINLIGNNPDDAEVKNVYDIYFEGDDITTLTASLGETYNWSPGIGLDNYNSQSVTISTFDVPKYSVLIYDVESCYYLEEFNISFSCDIITQNSVLIKLDTFVIENSSFQIKASESYSENYFWFPSTGLSDASIQNPVVTINDYPVNYSVEIKDKYGCSIYEGFYINIIDCDTIIQEKDIVRLDTLIKSGETVQLIPSKGSTLSENWIPSINLDCYDCINPRVTPNFSQQYKAILTDKYGCLFNEYFNIDVELFVPNAISPNNDGINDYLNIKGLPENSTLRIFNRDGNLLFESNNYSNNWDGRDKNGDILKSNTYWYHLIYEKVSFDDITVETTEKVQTGFIFIKW